MTQDEEAAPLVLRQEAAPPPPPAADQFWRAARSMYASHALSAWGQRMWEFAIGLIMLDLGAGSLALVAAFGLLDGAAVVAAGAPLGRFIDSTQRLRAGCAMYLLQNAALACSAALALLALSVRRQGPGFAACVAGLMLAGAVSSAGALGASLAVEREWAKALCGGDSARLAALNAGMRRIDLSCLIASPILVGFLMSYAGSRAAVLFIVAWNLLAWLPEWLFLRLAQSLSPALREQKPVAAAAGTAVGLISGWRVYSRQAVMPAALALALLYLTVLSFGLLATAYLKWRGMSEAELSLYRGLGALAGVSVTFLFPWLHARLGVVRAGLLGIWLQLACLAAAVAPAAAALASAAVAPAALTHALVGGLVASRFGLWLFDLAVGQLLQERVQTEELGQVNGVQGSLASACQGLSYAAALLSPDPARFEWLMLGSWAVVCLAALLYSVWACRQPRASQPQPQPQ